MVLAVVLAFILGVAVGLAYARWRVGLADSAADGTGSMGATTPRPGLADPGASLVAPVAAPNKRGRKAGLTDADFTPSDDILERLRLAAEGELDPAALHVDGEPPPAAPVPEAAAEPTLDPTTMTEAERRVFDRLRRMEGAADDAGPAEPGGDSQPGSSLA